MAPQVDRRGLAMRSRCTRNWVTTMVTLTVVLLTLGVASPVGAAPRPSPSVEALQVVKQSAVYDPATGLVRFRLTFDRRPNFVDTDEFGRRADQFQYYVVGDATLDHPYKYDAIIRIESPAFESSQLIIRNAAPSSSDPESGGWGTIRATVSYRLHGRTLIFSAPLSALSDHSADGTFAYELETYRYGSVADHVDGMSTIRRR